MMKMGHQIFCNALDSGEINKLSCNILLNNPNKIKYKKHIVEKKLPHLIQRKSASSLYKKNKESITTKLFVIN